jgi:hypothetical protein
MGGLPGIDAEGYVTSAREGTVRRTLIDYVARAHKGVPVRFVPELDLCQAQARIDLAAINGRLCGWEIKTAADSLTRLPRQEHVYSRVFDRVWLVADRRHIDRGLTMIPDWWGVLRVDGDSTSCKLRQVRGSRLNPRVDLFSLVRLLWRHEVLEELHNLGLSSGLERLPRAKLWEQLALAVPSRLTRPELQRHVRAKLTAREGWRADSPRTLGDD